MKKTLQRFLPLLFLIIGACKTNMPISTVVPDNNTTFQVDYLFELDGCKIYRFYDQGRWVYFSKCDNSMSVINRDSTSVTINRMDKPVVVK